MEGWRRFDHAPVALDRAEPGSFYGAHKDPGADIPMVVRCPCASDEHEVLPTPGRSAGLEGA
jgi:hypothetical protein